MQNDIDFKLLELKLIHYNHIMYHTFMTWQGYYDDRHDLHQWGWYVRNKREFFKKDVVEGERILEIALREIHCAANWQSIAQYKQHHVCVLSQYTPQDGPRAGDIWGGPRMIDFAKGYNCLPLATSDVEQIQCMALGCNDDWNAGADLSSFSSPFVMLPLGDFGNTDKTQEAKCQGAYEQWNSCAATEQPQGVELCNPSDDDDSGSDTSVSITLCHERCTCEPGYKYNFNNTCVHADYCNTDEDNFVVWNLYDADGELRNPLDIAKDENKQFSFATTMGAHGNGEFSKCWDVYASANSKKRIDFGRQDYIQNRMPCYQAVRSKYHNLNEHMYNQCIDSGKFLSDLDRSGGVTARVKFQSD